MVDLVYGYTDPIMVKRDRKRFPHDERPGSVYCSDENEALDMAERTGGKAWVEFWQDGNAVVRSDLVRLEHVSAEQAEFNFQEERALKLRRNMGTDE
jgi:hypothetical protein